MSRHKFFGGMQTVTSCISVTLVLVLLGAVIFFSQLMRDVSRSMRENLVVTVMMSDDATDAQTMDFAKYLESQIYVADVTLVSSEQALKEQTEAMGTDPSEFIGVNPFTASIDMHMAADYANSDSIQKVTHSLKDNKIVSDIVYQKDLIDQVNGNVNRITLVLLALASLLCFVSIVLINNTVRLSIYSRRFLIHTMRLVGASWGFIRRPFMARAFWMGIAAGVFANGILGVGIKLLMDFDATIQPFINIQMLGITCGAVFAVGMVITMFSSLITVNHYLNMREEKMY